MSQPYVGERYIRLPEQCLILGCSRATVYNLEKNDPSFPPAYKIGSRFVARKLSEVLAYANNRPLAKPPLEPVTVYGGE